MGPNGNPQPIQVRPEELRAIPCKRCGNLEFEPRPYVQVMVHRFKPDLVFYVKKERYHCSCGEVIDPEAKT